MDKALDTALISRSLNYHGAQLKKSWEAERGEEDLQKLGVESIDFKLYQERNTNLSFQDRSKRFKVYQFISKNVNSLFDEVLNSKKETSKDLPPPSDDHCAVMPPFDVFLDIDKKEKAEHFLDTVKPGDLIIGSLFTKLSVGYTIKILYCEGSIQRVLADVGAKAIIHFANMIPAVDKKNTSRNFLINDLVCCEVLEVASSSEKIFVGMKGDLCSPSDRPRLGLIHSEDMPLPYNCFKTNVIHGS